MRPRTWLQYSRALMPLLAKASAQLLRFVTFLLSHTFLGHRPFFPKAFLAATHTDARALKLRSPSHFRHLPNRESQSTVNYPHAPCNSYFSIRCSCVRSTSESHVSRKNLFWFPIACSLLTVFYFYCSALMVVRLTWLRNCCKSLPVAYLEFRLTTGDHKTVRSTSQSLRRALQFA